MTAVAAETALTRTRLKRRVLMVPVTLAFLTTVTLVGFYFLGFVLQLDAIFSARYFIPVFGIIMGNMLGVNVMGLNTYYSGLQRERQLYLYLLGNGATRHEATAPFVRQALVKAFSPGIANMAVTGLVALPGTMIGQILGGSSPNVAIKYQIMIIVITTASSMLSLIITLALASRRSFDAYGRLLNVYQEDKR
jgi:putative ABC transport system permease protein